MNGPVRQPVLPLVLGLVFSIAAHLVVGVAWVQSRVAQPLADLVAEGLIGCEPIVGHAPAEFSVAITNQGPIPATSFDITWQINDQPPVTQTHTRPLAPGQSHIQTYTFNDIPPGLHTVRVTLNADQRLTESRYDNNALEQTFIWLNSTPEVDETDEAMRAAALLPDLIIGDIQPTGELVAGQPARFHVSIANVGHAPAAAHDLRVMLNDQPRVDVVVDRVLQPGQFITVPVEVLADDAGRHRVCAVADVHGVVDEMREDNNAHCDVFDWRTEDEVLFGSLRGEGLQVRLVTLDEFEAVQARAIDDLEQPMVQTTATPTPQAPVVIVDPTEPAPNTPQVAMTAPSAAPAMPPPSAPPTEPQPETAEVSEAPEESADRESVVATIAPSVDAHADQAVAPEQAPARPPDAIEPAGEAERIQPLIDQTPTSSEIDDRSTFEGDSTEMVRNIQPPVAPSVVRETGDLPRAIDRGLVSEQVRQAGADRQPDDQADPEQQTIEVASIVPAERHLPALPVEADRDALPTSPVAESASDASDATTQAAAEQIAPQPPVEPPTEATKPDTPSEASQATPTMAPRDRSEAPPVSRIDFAEIRPGGVQAVAGVQLNTVTPRFSTVARMTSVPTNPAYRLVFNGQGQVTKVEQLRSTGYVNVDAPIITALYRWTAEGNIAEDGMVLERLEIHLGQREE